MFEVELPKWMAAPVLTLCCVSRVQSGEKQGKVTKLSKNEVLMLNIGSMCTGARVIAVRPPPNQLYPETS